MATGCTFQIAGRWSRGIALGWLAATSAFLCLQPATSHAQTVVRDIDNPAQRPFQVELTEQLRLSTSGGRQSIQIANPPLGTRLVIEHISLRASALEATTPGSHQTRFLIHGSLLTKADAVGANHELVVTRADFEAGSANSASQPIRVYADGGSPVFVRIGARTESGRSTLLSISVTISGYLVDVPDAPPDGRDISLPANGL